MSFAIKTETTNPYTATIPIYKKQPPTSHDNGNQRFHHSIVERD
jgi:hypothetical protein